MPFVDFPLECTTCRGSGKTTPASAFAVNEGFLARECLTCQGKGTIKNMVYVNPLKENAYNEIYIGDTVTFDLPVSQLPKDKPFSPEEIEKNKNEISKLYPKGNIITYDSPEDVNEIVEEVKNIKESKKSRKVEMDNAA